MSDTTITYPTAEDYSLREYVINMTLRRDRETCAAYPIRKSNPSYEKYLELVRSAVIKYKTENPTPSQALIFYSFAYENGVLPADNSIIIRVQHGNEYHQFHVLMNDIQSFDFWKYNILSTTRAIDRRTEYSANGTQQHTLTCSMGDSTYAFLKTYGK